MSSQPSCYAFCWKSVDKQQEVQDQNDLDRVSNDSFGKFGVLLNELGQVVKSSCCSEHTM